MNLFSRSCTLFVVTSASVALASCTVKSRARVDSAAADTATSATSKAVSAAGVNADANVTPPASGDSARTATTSSTSSAASPAASSAAANTVSFAGVPPLRIGMSEAKARSALGMPATKGTGSKACRYLDTGGRSHAFVMLVRDTVARLDVRDSTLATDTGVRVGDAESRVKSLYAGKVTVQPHKYVQGGHYLVVSAPADSTRRLVFETDGKRVTSYRVGRMPEVSWVEGCS